MHSATDRAKPHLLGIFIDKFQSISEPAYIRLNGITMLYGPNSAGKSTVLDALEIINKLNNDDENTYKIEYIWNTLCSDKTRIGITYRGMQIEEGDGLRQSNWIKKEISYSKPHIDFISSVIGKEISVEFSNYGNTVKIAVDTHPLFEIAGWELRPFNEDFSLAKTDEQIASAEDAFREIMGELTFYINHPLFQDLLPELYSFYEIASRKRGMPIASRRGGRGKEAQRIKKCSELEMFFEDKGDLFTIFGVNLSPDGNYWDTRGYQVEMGDEVRSIIKNNETNFKDRYIKPISNENRTKFFLFNEIRDAANTIDMILEGIRFQINKAIKRSCVSGGRGIVNSDMPAYISAGFGISKIIKTSQFQEHTAAYAESRSKYSKKLWVSSAMSPLEYDFVNYAMAKYMDSLSGYKINAEVHISKPKHKATARENLWRGHKENLMVFLNVQDPTGRILSFKDVGSGLSYALPIFTSLWASNLSFIEQPELHLHPAAQCEIGDVFIAAKNMGSVSVIESHSEHLLLRILRRIRESTKGRKVSKSLAISKDEVNIYYFNPIPGEGTKVLEIRIDRFGELLTRWPGGFFSERDKELFS